MAKQATMKNAALKQLTKDADEILHLIKVQLDNLTLPSCPLYEEVLDTQMFGLQKEVDFAVKLGLVDREDGKQIMLRLEKELSKFLFYTCLRFNI
ncbi:YlaN family protein [Staphylococcus aureus]